MNNEENKPSEQPDIPEPENPGEPVVKMPNNEENKPSEQPDIPEPENPGEPVAKMPKDFKPSGLWLRRNKPSQK